MKFTPLMLVTLGICVAALVEACVLTVQGLKNEKEKNGSGASSLKLGFLSIVISVIFGLLSVYLAGSTEPSGENSIISIIGKNEGEIIYGDVDNSTTNNYYIQATAAPTIQPTISPTSSTSTMPTKDQTATVNPMKTIYGKAWWEEVNGLASYSGRDAISIVSDTYYDRKDKNKKYKDGYDSHGEYYQEYGYRLGFYYADDFLYFAEVRDGDSQILVRLYYWEDTLIACNDVRNGGDGMYTVGSEIFENVVAEFGYVYSVGLRRPFYE